MGTARAPVVGSGPAPECTARVRKPQVSSIMRPCCQVKSGRSRCVRFSSYIPGVRASRSTQSQISRASAPRGIRLMTGPKNEVSSAVPGENVRIGVPTSPPVRLERDRGLLAEHLVPLLVVGGRHDVAAEAGGRDRLADQRVVRLTDLLRAAPLVVQPCAVLGVEAADGVVPSRDVGRPPRRAASCGRRRARVRTVRSGRARSPCPRSRCEGR